MEIVYIHYSPILRPSFVPKYAEIVYSFLHFRSGDVSSSHITRNGLIGDQRRHMYAGDMGLAIFPVMPVILDHLLKLGTVLQIRLAKIGRRRDHGYMVHTLLTWLTPSS